MANTAQNKKALTPEEGTEEKQKTASNQKTTNSQKTASSRKSAIPKDVDPSQYVVVYNGFQGTLTYKSSRTGEVTTWDGFGAEQEMELRELKNAKSSHKNFFVNNWFMFDEDWVIDYLGVRKYYENALSLDHFDDVFHKRPAEIKKIVDKLSAGQKKSLMYRAKELIADNKIDSLSVITALEEALGVELIEK